MAGLFAEAIERVHAGESVSSLFDGVDPSLGPPAAAAVRLAGFETGAERLPQPAINDSRWLRRLRSNRLEAPDDGASGDQLRSSPT